MFSLLLTLSQISSYFSHTSSSSKETCFCYRFQNIFVPTKSEIKKKLEHSIASGKKSENTDIEQMAKNCTESKKDVAKIIHEFEEIIRNKKGDIVWLAYHQGKIFQKFRLKERFVNDMVSKFKVSKIDDSA